MLTGGKVAEISSALEPPPVEFVADCPLCGTREFQELYPVWDRLHRLPGSFHHVKCACGLVLLSPRPKPDVVGFYYPGCDYYSYSAAAAIDTLRHRGKLEKPRQILREAALLQYGYPIAHRSLAHVLVGPLLRGSIRNAALYGMADRFPAYRDGGRALDIGCGAGSFLSYLKHHGWSVAGVEISRRAAETARTRFGIEVFVGDVRDAGFEPASFDFIHLGHVIEHLPNPVRTLEDIALLLKPGGLVNIETPNVESFGAKRFRDRWFHNDAPRHFFLFSPATLLRAVRQARLKPVGLKTHVDPTGAAWAESYRFEETNTFVPAGRPHVRRTRLPGVIAQSFAAQADRLLHPHSGDIIVCRATR